MLVGLDLRVFGVARGSSVEGCPRALDVVERYAQHLRLETSTVIRLVEPQMLSECPTRYALLLVCNGSAPRFFSNESSRSYL